tara:strand:+ start:6384 stop:6986 length:603 start_codon:yes stop_codon:yes gene_type:complete
MKAEKLYREALARHGLANCISPMIKDIVYTIVEAMEKERLEAVAEALQDVANAYPKGDIPRNTHLKEALDYELELNHLDKVEFSEALAYKKHIGIPKDATDTDKIIYDALQQQAIDEFSNSDNTKLALKLAIALNPFEFDPADFPFKVEASTNKPPKFDKEHFKALLHRSSHRGEGKNFMNDTLKLAFPEGGEGCPPSEK